MAERRWHQLYFEDWVAREGLELVGGHRVGNIYTMPLRGWERTGGKAVQIQLEGTGELNAAYVQEIAASNQLKPQRHLYEELIYILSGRGATSVWVDPEHKGTFEWQTGSLFAIPLNSWHQHFNTSGDEGARYLAVTTAPVMMNLLRNDDAIFNSNLSFPERYQGEHGYFSGEIEEDDYLGWGQPYHVNFSNLFSDIHALPLHELNRGVDTRGNQFELANGVLSAHLLEMPGGTFTKLHRHGPGAHVIWLKGEGYTVLFPDGGEMTKEEWGPGTMLVPPAFWWHQHCCVTKEPGLHLALKLSSRRNIVTKASTATLKSTREGGNQMDFEDMPRQQLDMLKRMFAEECERRGTPARMEAIRGG
ncbi:MAG TPA: cupin domain-containing protein [Chloroflexota bacterium]|nr:cupin domain-containing protein [Chloroflexota bacterium]